MTWPRSWMMMRRRRRIRRRMRMTVIKIRLDNVASLVEAKAEPNLGDEDGRTSLMRAAADGHAEAMAVRGSTTKPYRT